MKNLFVVFMVLAVALSGVRCTTDERPVPEESQPTEARTAPIIDAVHAGRIGTEQTASSVRNDSFYNPIAPENVNLLVVKPFRDSRNCKSGFGVCDVIVAGLCVYCPDHTSMVVQVVGNESQLRIYFPENMPYTSNDLFHVENAHVVDQSVALQLGYSEIVVQTGAYSVVAVPGTTTPDYVNIPIASIN